MGDPQNLNPTPAAAPGAPAAPPPPASAPPPPPVAPLPPQGPPPPPRAPARAPASPGQPAPAAGPGGGLADQIAARTRRAEAHQFGSREEQAEGEATDNLAGKFVNSGCDCLTYETLFNQKKFRKTNQQREMGLYRIPLERVKLFICQGISDAQLKELADAFFPDLTPDDVVALSRKYCPWQPASKTPATADLASPEQLAATRGDNVVHVGVSAVMPYNFKDNVSESRAIGTVEESHFHARLARLKATWPMWNTASRSSVAKVSRVKPTGEPWSSQAQPQPSASPGAPANSYDFAGPYQWDFGGGDPSIDPTDIAKSRNFKLKAADHCFSIKTGVSFIGTSNQIGSAGGNKDVLEENSLDACLRSDYISIVDEKMNRRPKGDPHLLLLKELLTITERSLEPGKTDEPGDGMQVRDISVLDGGKVYFPPLSIPFVDGQLKNLTRRYQEAANEEWVNFWKNAYAAALGRAKALLLLRYGLQPGSPNAQNFLIEMSLDLKPTGCIVVRDLGDAQLHREVAWALYGPPSAPLPKAGDAGWPELAKLSLPPLNYECTSLLKIKGFIMETGVIDPTGAYGKVAGTQMRWTAFSALSKGRTVADAEGKGSTDQDVRARGWQRVLEVNAEWGRAHAEAYVACIESCLSLRCNVDWASAKDPKRYGRLGPTDYSQAGEYYKEDLAWEEAASGAVHRVLASPEGRNAIREYKQGGWKPK